MRVHRLAFFAALLPLASLSAQQQAPPAAKQQGFTIGGIVVNSVTNQPVSGAKVLIAPVTARSSTVNETTGPDGRFAFTGLPAAKYSIEASARGYREQGLNQHDFYASAVVTGPELDAAHIVFRLEADASIDGRITDEENEAVENASVRLYRKTNEEGQEKVVPADGTDADDRGQYHIGHLAPGTYYLVVAARPWYAQAYRPRPMPDRNPDVAAHEAAESAEFDRAFPLTFYPSSLDSAGAGAITLHAGDRFTADMTLQSVKAVNLRVRDPEAGASGPPMNRIELRERVFNILEPVLQGINMAAMQPGTFDVWGLPPGHYLVEARPSNPNGKGVGSGWIQEVDLTGDTELTVGGNSGFANVSGLIRFEGGQPEQAQVLMRNPDTGEQFYAPISKDGQFTFRDDHFRPGKYEIVLSNAQGFSLQKMMAAGATVSGRSLEITSPGTVHLAGIAAHGIGQVNGIALRDGKGVAGVMVVLVPKDPAHNQPLFRRDQSDSDGTFSLIGVVPGAYTVIAIENGWELEWADPGVLQRYLKAGEPVQVTGGSTLDVKVQVQ